MRETNKNGNIWASFLLGKGVNRPVVLEVVEEARQRLIDCVCNLDSDCVDYSCKNEAIGGTDGRDQNLENQTFEEEGEESRKKKKPCEWQALPPTFPAKS